MSPVWCCSGSQDKAQVTGQGGCPHQPCCSTRHCPGSDVSATAGSCSLLSSFPPPAVLLAQLKPLFFTPTSILSLLVEQLNRSSLSQHRWVFSLMLVLEALNCITWIPAGFLLPRDSECSTINVQQRKAKEEFSLCPAFLPSQEASNPLLL